MIFEIIKDLQLIPSIVWKGEGMIEPHLRMGAIKSYAIIVFNGSSKLGHFYNGILYGPCMIVGGLRSCYCDGVPFNGEF